MAAPSPTRPWRGTRFLAVLGLWIGWVGAWSQDGVRVNVDDANPPFMFARGGRAAGVYPALLGAAFGDMNASVLIEAKPWRRVLAEIDAGEAGVGGIYKNSERSKHFDYSDPLFVERINIYARRQDGARYTNLQALKGSRVGVIRGWSYGDSFDQLRKSGAIVAEDTGSDEQNFAMLEAGRLDAVLAITEAAEAQLKKHSALMLAGAMAENATYLAFNKSAAMGPFIVRFNAALARLKRSGAAKRIVSQALDRP